MPSGTVHVLTLIPPTIYMTTAPKPEPEKPPTKSSVASHSHKPPPTVAPAAKPHVDVKSVSAL